MERSAQNNRNLGACLPLLAVLLLAFALRVFRLGYQELRGDEAFGYFFSLNPIPDIVLRTISLREPHPVASYFVQKGWLALAGHSEFALRFVSAWFAVLAVALLYGLARRLAIGRPTAILAAALLAISPYAIWHSQDSRMYSMSLALTLASTWLAMQILGGRRSWASLAGYVLVSWLALHTHYFAAFVLLAQTIYVLGLSLVDRRYRRQLVPWLGLQVVVGLLYLPWLVAAGDTLRTYSGAADSPGLASALSRALSVFVAGETVPAAWPWWTAAIALLAGLLVGIGAIRLALSSSPGRRALWLLALYLAVPLAATWLSSRQRPIFDERYLIAAAPPFYLLVAVAVLGFEGRRLVRTTPAGAPARQAPAALGWIAAGGLVVWLLAGGTSLARYYADPALSRTQGWRELAAALERYSAGLPPAQVRLVQNYPDPTLWYYYDGPVEHLVLPPSEFDAAGAQRHAAALAAAGVERVVAQVQPADNWDPSGLAQQALQSHFTEVAATEVGDWPVQVYVRPPAALEPAGSSFANGLQLSGVSVQPDVLVPGDVLAVTMQWAGLAPGASGGAKLSLQLLDASGRLVAQTDRPLVVPAAGAGPASYGIALPETLPPGAYRLILAIYNPAEPGAPRWLTSAGRDHVDLGPLRTLDQPSE